MITEANVLGARLDFTLDLYGIVMITRTVAWVAPTEGTGSLTEGR